MKLVLLDRDGVINKDLPTSVRKREEFTLLPRVGEAIRRLNEAGIPVAIVTNQAVVGRGDITDADLEDIHLHMAALLKEKGAFIDLIFTCTSADKDDPRRKPNPGLVWEALETFEVQPQEAVLIGDALRDLEAAHKAGCPSILVRTGKGAETEQELPGAVVPLAIVDDLFDAVGWLLST